MQRETSPNWLRRMFSWSIKEQLFLVTVITAWAYGSAIEFNKAYMDYFNCGIYYEMQLWVIYDIVIIILPCFVTCFFTYYIFKGLPVKLLAIILFISLMIGFFPDNFLGWFLYLLKQTFGITVYFLCLKKLIEKWEPKAKLIILSGRLQLLLKNWKNTLRDVLFILFYKLIELIKKSTDILSNPLNVLWIIDKIEMKFFKTILLYPVVVFTAIFYPTTIFDIVDIPRDYGKWVASEQKEFFIITYPEKEKGNVIINTYKDYFIVAPLKKDSILSSEVHLVKQDAVRIKEKKIGPLKVQD